MAFQSPIVAFSIKSCLWQRLQSNPINHTDNSPASSRSPSQGRVNEWDRLIDHCCCWVFFFSCCFHFGLCFNSYLTLKDVDSLYCTPSIFVSVCSCVCVCACARAGTWSRACVGVRPSKQQHSYWSADCWVRPSGPLAVRSCQGWELIMTGGVHTLEVWQTQGTVPCNNSLYYWHRGYDGSL